MAAPIVITVDGTPPDTEVRFMDTQGATLALFTVGQLVGEEGTCWRCSNPVTSQVEAVWLDTAARNDCPESEDGAPHEIAEHGRLLGRSPS